MKPKQTTCAVNTLEIKEPVLVSVIIPVYKVEVYLDRCIKSVLAQTYSNFELLLVDDGSLDASGVLCDRWAALDDRIFALHTQNGGQGYARNLGLDLASGRYIVFVDSDDYIHKDYIATMLSLAENTQADIVQTKIRITDSVDLDMDSAVEQFSYFITDGKHAPNLFAYKVAPYAKLYKQEMLSHIRFGRWKVNEDDAIYYRIAYRAETICIADVYLYNYYQSPNSVMRNNAKDKPLDYIDIYYERLAFFEGEKQAVLLEGSRDRFCLILLLNYIDYVKNNTNAADLERMRTVFREQYTLLKRAKTVSPVKKLIYRLFTVAPTLLTRLALLLRLR